MVMRYLAGAPVALGVTVYCIGKAMEEYGKEQARIQEERIKYKY